MAKTTTQNPDVESTRLLGWQWMELEVGTHSYVQMNLLNAESLSPPSLYSGEICEAPSGSYILKNLNKCYFNKSQATGKLIT